MVEYSRTQGDSSYRYPSRVADKPICQVCMGRKYRLVATRKLNQSSTMYERQVCQACAVEEIVPQREEHSVVPHSALQSVKKTSSGTGYLRNKKRRRKEVS